MTRKPGAHSRTAPAPELDSDSTRTRIGRAEARRLLAGRPVRDERNLDLQLLLTAAAATGSTPSPNSSSASISISIPRPLRNQDEPRSNPRPGAQGNAQSDAQSDARSSAQSNDRARHQPWNQSPETADTELGLSAVLAAFNAAPAPRRPSRAPMRYRWHRALAVKLAAALLFLSGAVMSAAAAAGVLPASVQHAAHDVFGDLGVPGPPNGTARPSQHPSTGPTGATTGPSPQASAGGATTAPGSADPSPTALCESAARDEYASHAALDPSDQASLIADAGGANKVIPYCLHILSSAGYGNGNGYNGNGNNNYNWYDPTTPTHTTPPSTAPTAGNGQNRTTPPEAPEPTRTHTRTYR